MALRKAIKDMKKPDVYDHISANTHLGVERDVPGSKVFNLWDVLSEEFTGGLKIGHLHITVKSPAGTPCNCFLTMLRKTQVSSQQLDVCFPLERTPKFS